MIWVLFLPLTPYLLWLLWAAAVHPIPLSYNWRSIWPRWAGTLSTVGAIAIVWARRNRWGAGPLVGILFFAERRFRAIEKRGGIIRSLISPQFQ